MRKKHLILIVDNTTKKKTWVQETIELGQEVWDTICALFVSKEEKMCVVYNELLKIYKEYEETVMFDIELPYFIKADKMLYKIVREKKLNYYYFKFRNKAGQRR